MIGELLKNDENLLTTFLKFTDCSHKKINIDIYLIMSNESMKIFEQFCS